MKRMSFALTLSTLLLCIGCNKNQKSNNTSSAVKQMNELCQWTKNNFSSSEQQDPAQFAYKFAQMREKIITNQSLANGFKGLSVVNASEKETIYRKILEENNINDFDCPTLEAMYF